MTEFAIASSAAQAVSGTGPLARTQHDAQARAAGAVTLAVEPLPQVFADAASAHAAFPELFQLGGEVVLFEGAWRIMVRFWRPLPPLPVARSAKLALVEPIGTARTEAEAEALAGGPVTALSEPLPARYASILAARRRWGALLDAGLADIQPKGERFAVAIKYWRPTPPEVAAQELAARLAAPLKARVAQAPMDVGLFEGRAPENPDVVLVTEEGDGRRHQE